MLRRATLALDEPPGELACGVEPLLDCNCQGEEINALTWGFAGGGGCQDDSLAIADKHSATCLLGDAASLDAEGPPGDLGFNFVNHTCSLRRSTRHDRCLERS